MESVDEINELEQAGWVNISEKRVKLHLLIRETISQIAWTEKERKLARQEMKALYQELFVQQTEQALIRDSVQRKRFRDSQKTAWAVLSQCGLDGKLPKEQGFKELLLKTLLCAPREQEEQIIRGAEWLFADPTYQNPYGVIELYDYVAYLFCQKPELKKARSYIRRAMAFARNKKDAYLIGTVYDMLADYYETCLDGAYDAIDKETEKLVQKLFWAVDASIFWMEKSGRRQEKRRLAKQKLGKAALLIRSQPEQRQEIRMLILDVKRFLKEEQNEDQEIRENYLLVCAWYHTLCERNEPAVIAYLNQAEQLQNQRSQPDLEWIDEFLIPAANMMLELRNGEAAVSWLEEGLRRCCGHPEELPYIRKKQDLLQYEMEVYELMEKEERKDRCT